jgi:SET domain-containing protein
MKIRLRIGPSRIAGQGVFAAQEIPQGNRIIYYRGEKISTAESAERLVQVSDPVRLAGYFVTYNKKSPLAMSLTDRGDSLRRYLNTPPLSLPSSRVFT